MTGCTGCALLFIYIPLFLFGFCCMLLSNLLRITTTSAWGCLGSSVTLILGLLVGIGLMIAGLFCTPLFFLGFFLVLYALCELRERPDPDGRK